MADADTPSPEQNEDPAAEAVPAEPAGGSDAAETDATDAMDEAADEAAPADGAESSDGASVAETLAAEALQAAQQAVSGLGSDDADDAGSDDAASATDSASADADAAMAAMMDAQAVPMPSLSQDAHAEVPKGIDLLADVNLDVTIELGRTRMYVEDVLKLSEGAVVELDKLAGDPVDIYVNNRLVAKGEVLILNDNFCVRVNDIIQLQPEAAAG